MGITTTNCQSWMTENKHLWHDASRCNIKASSKSEKCHRDISNTLEWFQRIMWIHETNVYLMSCYILKHPDNSLCVSLVLRISSFLRFLFPVAVCVAIPLMYSALQRAAMFGPIHLFCVLPVLSWCRSFQLQHFRLLGKNLHIEPQTLTIPCRHDKA